MNTRTALQLHILIVGGGIAGLILALLLERQGMAVTLAERNKEWKPAGGGVTLTFNGVAALRSIGLLPAIRAKANPIDAINITTQQGRVLSSFNLQEYTTTYAPTLTILRTDLHRILAEQLRHTTIYTDTVVEHIEPVKDKTKVTLRNGHSAQYNVVVGCDGIHSSIRQYIFPQAHSSYAGYASWRFVVQGVNFTNTATLSEMWGKGKRFGIVPLTDGRVHCFASVNTPPYSAENKNISSAAFKKLFAGFGEPVPLLLDALEEGNLIYNDLEDIRLPQWHKGRIVLIGDAAHGMTPNMTQGASMAIEDAIVLAAELGKMTGIEQALERFHHLRAGRVKSIQHKSWLLGRIGQLQQPALCALRNFCWKHIPDKWIQSDLKQLLVNGVYHPEKTTTYSPIISPHAVYHT